VRALSYAWSEGGGEHTIRLVPVEGTGGKPFLFGAGDRRIPIEIRGFHLLATPVTQELWTHVMGSNPSKHPAARHPVENVSWDQITGPGGFLERINAGDVLRGLAASGGPSRFRLPSETEWEYAARGGPRWTDEFRFSGSNDIDKVAWYGPRFGPVRRLVCRILGWRVGWRLMGRFPRGRPRHTHEVATKAPNQLGLYDMSGNVWEWCQDTSTEDLDAVPRDGAPFVGPGPERRLRGGCNHNWDLHCTVWWRYGIAPASHDGALGLRLVLAPA
jgi:formylglycine-generating enzyme required for sulfatase activity